MSKTLSVGQETRWISEMVIKSHLRHIPIVGYGYALIRETDRDFPAFHFESVHDFHLWLYDQGCIEYLLVPTISMSRNCS